MSSPEDDPLAELPWREEPAPKPETTAAIHATCTRGLECRRGASARRRALVSILLSGTIVGGLVLLGLRHGTVDEPLKWALVGAAVWGVVHALVLFFGLARPPGRRGSRGLRIGVAVALPILFFAYLAAAASNTLAFGQFLHQGVAHTSSCGLFSLLFGAVAAGGTLMAWRRTDPLTPGLSGALAGLCGGLASAVGIGVACPSHEGWHLWLAHGTTLVVFVFAGWVIGRKWLAP
jgi:hypothetical protein